MSFWNQNINVGSTGTTPGGGTGRSPIIQIPLSALTSPYSPSYPTKQLGSQMETESVRSGHSDRSKRSGHHKTSANTAGSHHKGRRHHRSNRSTSSHHYKNDNRDVDEQHIEVQILPQDENWGDNTTVVTGNTSDHSVSMDDISKLGMNKDQHYDNEQGIAFKCQMWIGSIVAAFISVFAFVSPILMVVLPKLEIFHWNIVRKCGPECDGILISFAFKLLILFVGTWALFLRQPKATMPRIFTFRAIVLSLIFVFTFSYWLFYAVRVIESQQENAEYLVTYYSILLFAVSLVDALLFIHYLAVILIEVRQLQPQYMIKVVRSPDGESHSFNVGQLSIQRAAVFVLENYYQTFSIYNPYLERLPIKSNRKSASQLKFYDVDSGDVTSNMNNGSQIGGGGDHSSPRHRRGGRDASSSHHHSDRFYEEQEYERRVRKRRGRLIAATEEAFTHIKRLNNDPGPAQPMDPFEAAQAVFPSLARSLQKYLRVTRQQPQHTMQSILNHLALCLSHDLSPKAFLEKYLKTDPVLQSDREHKPVQTWALVCDVLLSRAIQHNLVFQLRQNDVSLLVTVHQIPHFNITEEIIDPKSNKFVLRLNSETSV